MPTKKKTEEVTEKPVKKAATKKTATKKAPAKKPVAPKKPLTANPKADPSSAKVAEGRKETKKAVSAEKQKIRVIIRAFDHKIADESAKTIIETAERTGSLVTGAIPLPTRKERITLNRSTFINKDAREQFEMRTHKRLIDITDYTPTTIDSLSNLNLPAGVDVEIKML